jgi:hypothetical protein
MNFDEIRQIALSFPGVTEHQVFGGPTLRVGKRFLACIAKIDPDTLCIKVPDPLQRDVLLNSKSETYYLTDHYANFECLLVRMPNVDPDELRDLFEGAWLAYAPRRAVAAYQANLQKQDG